jgi:hypothetical protein
VFKDASGRLAAHRGLLKAYMYACTQLSLIALSLLLLQTALQACKAAQLGLPSPEFHAALPAGCLWASGRVCIKSFMFAALQAEEAKQGLGHGLLQLILYVHVCGA